MNDQNAQRLLAAVMGWQDRDAELIRRHVFDLQLLATLKYDSYQKFAPGRRFIESLALWLEQFDQSDRSDALRLVLERLVFISEAEYFHLVQIAHPDVIVPERRRLVAEENGIPSHKIGALETHQRFRELSLKSLYLGLSDGARTSEIRRASHGQIRNSQIWQAYELGQEKADDMLKELSAALSHRGFAEPDPRFTLVWLLDDFSGSGHTYIRLQDGVYKGKIKRAFDAIHRVGLVDPTHYEVFLLLYVATRQAMDHINYWAERFTSEQGFKPLRMHVIHVIEPRVAIDGSSERHIDRLVSHERYYDPQAETEHTRVGGTENVRYGFADCRLPLVLPHNTPNNSLYILWGEEGLSFEGLFPRVSRHRDN